MKQRIWIFVAVFVCQIVVFVLLSHCKHGKLVHNQNDSPATTPSLAKFRRENGFDSTLVEGPPYGFEPGMTPEEKRHTLSMLEILDKVMTRLKVPYFLIAGSLVGVFRHAGIVPWDDDLDIVIPYQSRESVFKALQPYQGLYETWTWHGSVKPLKHWKLYLRDGFPNTVETWRFPFVDVFFYFENATHLWFPDDAGQTVFNRNDIFPLKYTKFESISVLVPRNVTNVLTASVDITEFRNCTSNYYYHKFERLHDPGYYRTIPCELLKRYYHFADRTANPI